MKTLKVEVFQSDEAYYSWLKARNAGLRVSKYTPIIVPEDDCTTAHIIVKCKRLDTAIKHAKEAFADYSDVVEALEELECKRAEDKHVTGISYRYNTISTCYNDIDGEYSFYIVAEARDEVTETAAAADSNTKAENGTEAEADTETENDTAETTDETANKEAKEGKKMKLAERYTSNKDFSCAIITERKDGKFLVATNCGENGDKCHQWKIFDTYHQARDYLRDAGYYAIKQIIEIDGSTGESENRDEEILTDGEAPIKVTDTAEETKVDTIMTILSNNAAKTYYNLSSAIYDYNRDNGKWRPTNVIHVDDPNGALRSAVLAVYYADQMRDKLHHLREQVVMMHDRAKGYTDVMYADDCQCKEELDMQEYVFNFCDKTQRTMDQLGKIVDDADNKYWAAVDAFRGALLAEAVALSAESKAIAMPAIKQIEALGLREMMSTVYDYAEKLGVEL